MAWYPLVIASSFLCRRWVVTPLFTRGKVSLLLFHSIGDKSFYPDSIAGAYGDHLIVQALNPLGLSATKMTLTPLGSQQLTSTGDVEATFGSFMGLKLWHPELPLPLLWL